ncbi:MAG TPA: MGMT family protein [Epulopiscium sp.]|nr:MGMT family protein [Candidatus Epulonipiscium sp.]
MQIHKIINFLETDTLSVTFSSNGLKYLSLRNNTGNELIDLKNFGKAEEENPMVYLLVKETWNFLDTGSHNMVLDLTGFTSFQQAVFEAVSTISTGNICTYKELAEILEKPGAAQAVGSAVAKNPVSYFIPTIEKLRGNYICSRNKCCLE